MEGIFEHQIRVAINRLKENNFQDFVDELLIRKYGKNFTCVKNKRDKGCDGIIEGKRIVADYAPEKHDLKEFKKKAKEDYDKYQTYWQMQYPEWCFVYNGKFTAEMIQFIDGLGLGLGKWDINQIMDDIKGLPWSKIRDIANYLGIDEQYFINDVLKNVVEDLLKGADSEPAAPSSKPPYIVDKIKLNYDESDVEAALNEYEDILPSLTELKNVLKPYSDKDVASLKNKIVVAYGTLSGDFKTRLNNLTGLLSERNKDDDLYKYYVRVVLIYLFEICLIGKKVQGEA